MRALLVRVGVDQAAGEWNAPVDPESREFVYVPIPESQRVRPVLATQYTAIRAAVHSFGVARSIQVELPPALARQRTHLDPDFDHLTYGDVGLRRGRALCEFAPGDMVVFFAGLRPVQPCVNMLLYAIIGIYRVAEIVRACDVPSQRWDENAHTRRAVVEPTDVIVRADPSSSGRLRRCIPFGEFRDRAYRVRRDLLEAWGGISSRNGYVQRSAVPPRLLRPDVFMRWFDAQRPELMRMNNPDFATRVAASGRNP